MPRLLRSETDRTADPDGDFLEILARGLRVITAFGPERPRMTLSEVAAVAELPRATVRRSLMTLERLGYVRSHERLFALTPQVLELASAYLSSNGVSVVAQPVVERVCRAIGETCSVAILEGAEVVFVARATPRRIVSIDLAVGYRLPALATAIGRILLAELPDDELDRFLAEVPARPLTPRTLVRADELRAAILDARANGFCIVDEEAELGLRSLAVPVRRYDGRAPCAIHVGVRSDQVALDRLRDAILPTLSDAARDIGRALV